MSEQKSAMLEIALRAVGQHLDRDEYAEAGDVVQQALSMADRTVAPVAAQEPAGWRDFLVQLSDLEGSMVNGNRLSRAAKELLAAAPAQPETWKVLPSPAGAPPLDDELRYILGRPCFTVISMAQALRAMGYEIQAKAEDEQAVSIHWMMDLYFKHGKEWRTEATRILQAAKDAESKRTGEPIQEAKE